MGLAISIVTVIAGYLLGSIPCAYGITRWRLGVDIRTLGDGNPGAANVFRSVGKVEGLAVFLLDAGKGVAAVALAQALPGEPWAPYAAGWAAVVGHNWPPYPGLSGGRGAATAVGVLAVFIPWLTPLGLALAAVPFVLKDRAVPILILLLGPLPLLLLWVGVSPFTLAYGAALCIFVGLTPLLRPRKR